MYTITLLLENKNNSYAFFAKLFRIEFRIQNIIISQAIKQVGKLEHDEIYVQTKEKYIINKKDEEKHKKEIRELKTIINERLEYYGLTQGQMYKFASIQQKKYKKYIKSHIVNAITDRVLQSVEKHVFSDGKTIYHRKFEDLHTISSKSLTNGIKLDIEHNLCIIGKLKFRYIFKNYNPYIKACFDKDVSHIKFCRIVRKDFNNGYRYYIQFVIDSNPIPKITKGIGSCGIDPGVSSFAITTDNICMLEDLAPEIEKYNREIIKIQKKMERSLRLNNKDCYNEDGTIKKGSSFKKSKNYRHLRKIYRTLNRKRSCYVKENQEKICNNIIQNCEHIFYEDMNFKALAKRGKKTEKQEKESSIQTKTGEKKIYKFKRKKRFGKVLKNKSPGQCLSILKRKCQFYGIEVVPINTTEFKASQYNHQFDDYRKKKLSDRWNVFYDEEYNPFLIQRDLYSSFLIKNSNEDLTHPDRIKCLKTFPKFVINHDVCISGILISNFHRLSCFGF